jgi:hypothetical protein
MDYSEIYLLRENAMNQQQLNPSELSNQQIIDLLWQVKGTPEAQPLYDELATRPQGETLSLDDPNWEEKFSALLIGTPQSVKNS